MFIYGDISGPGCGWMSIHIARRHCIRRTLIHREDMVSCLFFPDGLGVPFEATNEPMAALYCAVSTPIMGCST